jgi:hypothetical protein
MSDEQASRQTNVDELSNQLSEGLKTCRTMVANYRAMLGAGDNDNAAPMASDDPRQRNRERA